MLNVNFHLIHHFKRMPIQDLMNVQAVWHISYTILDMLKKDKIWKVAQFRPLQVLQLGYIYKIWQPNLI